jgi:solute carrier family 8 (sodium/calcium exchanger)
VQVDFQALELGATDWRAQFAGVCELEDESLKGRLFVAIAFPWRLMFACVPPPGLCGGWPCFVGALVGIAIQVVLISDFASQMGCQMYLKDSVTAITFVALGTSLPDTFASMQAAKHDKTADNSIGNVTGSNSVHAFLGLQPAPFPFPPHPIASHFTSSHPISPHPILIPSSQVNVFFGLGLPWLLAAVYWKVTPVTDEWRSRYADIPGLLEAYPDGAFVVRGDGLGFSVLVFTMCAVITIGVILLRRNCLQPAAELGGDPAAARASRNLLFALWLTYICFSTIKSYERELGLGNFGF